MSDTQNTSPQANPEAQNPSMGIGDLYRLLQAISEAVLTGQTEIPVIKLGIAGKHVELGPVPIKVV
ncbi:MAG TPA: hypothetical protein VL418_05580 [Devosiaceae bacterium]|jgi:hypothetical protein|nr:hypothetical protein [Devosiaceae bacterium]